MQRWEYKNLIWDRGDKKLSVDGVLVEIGRDNRNVYKIIEELGNVGWELVVVTSMTTSGGSYGERLWFKRAKL